MTGKKPPPPPDLSMVGELEEEMAAGSHQRSSSNWGDESVDGALLAPPSPTLEDRPEPRKGPGPKPALPRPTNLAEAKARLREQGKGSDETLITLREGDTIPDWVPTGGNIRILDFSWTDAEDESAAEPLYTEAQARAILRARGEAHGSGSNHGSDPAASPTAADPAFVQAQTYFDLGRMKGWEEASKVTIVWDWGSRQPRVPTSAEAGPSRVQLVPRSPNSEAGELTSQSPTESRADSPYTLLAHHVVKTGGEDAVLQDPHPLSAKQIKEWERALVAKAAIYGKKGQNFLEASHLLGQLTKLLAILSILALLARLPTGFAITSESFPGMAGVLGESSRGFSLTNRYESAYKQYQTAADNDGRKGALTAARYCGDQHLETQQSALAKRAADLLLAGDYSNAAKVQMELNFITQARSVFTGAPLKSVLNYSSEDDETRQDVALVIDDQDTEPIGVRVASVVVKPLHRKDSGGVTLEEGKLVPHSDISSDADEFGNADPPKKREGLTKNQRRRLNAQKRKKEPLPNSTAPLLTPPYYFSGRELSNHGRRATPEASVKRQLSRSRSPVRRPRTPEGCNICASTLRLLEQASRRHAQMTDLITRAVEMLKAEAASTSRPPVSLPQEKQRLEHRLSRR
jgi:hypothetical protein